MTLIPDSIRRVAPKASEYVNRMLDFGFHNASSLGFTERLEREFPRKFGMKYGIAHANGTCTMQSALMAADVGVGDEVISPAYTVYASALVALQCNAIPIIADVDPETWTIDPEDIRRKITPRTKAIIPVSICGLAPDMDPIMQIAKEHDLVVIEDNAQCVLGYYKDQLVGSMGHFASFSFQASKTLTCGDGGILICDDEELALKARRAAVAGFTALSAEPGHVVVAEELRCNPFFERHDSIGWNQRLPEIAAAVALAEFERIEEVVQMRVFAGKCFEQVVADCDWLVPQKTPEGYVHAYWTYAVRIMNDDLDWQAFRRKFVELGGDGFYGAYLPAHREPVFPKLSEAVEQDPERYPQWAGKLPDYRQWTCPVWEGIQPRIMQFKTNYFDTDTARREADILAKTIRHFS